MTLVNPFPVCNAHTALKFRISKQRVKVSAPPKCLATSTCKLPSIFQLMHVRDVHVAITAPCIRCMSCRGQCPRTVTVYINGAKVVMIIMFLSCSSIQRPLLLVNITYRVLFQFPPCVLFHFPQYSSSSYQHCCHFTAKVAIRVCSSQHSRISMRV